VSHTFPTPFSIVSQGHNDAKTVPSSLQIIKPVGNAELIPGSNVNITWEGVLISSVTILLSNKTSGLGETTVVASVANTGFFEWTVPLVLGEYTLSLVGDDRVRTPPIDVRIKSEESNRPSLAVVADLPAIISVGDVVNVEYASSGDVGRVTVELWSDAGFLLQITDSAPTNGSYRFEYVGNVQGEEAFLVLSSASGGARAESSRFSLYPRQHLSDVSVGGGGGRTVYKGMPFNVTWHSVGVPLVTILLYHGTPEERRTVSDQPCVPWKDRGLTHEGCILGVDLRSEMCATEVDHNGQWVVGGRCKPLDDTYRLIAVLHTGVSTDNLAQIILPATETALPAAETGYTVVVASTTSLKMEARSAEFAIDMPMVELTFPILLTEHAGTSRTIVLDVLQEILTSVLDINASRLGIDVTGWGVHNIVRVMIRPTTSVVQAAAYEAAQLFVQQWTDPTSALNEVAKKAAGFCLDTAGGDPTISLVVERMERVKDVHVGIAQIGVIAAGIIVGMLALVAFVLYVARRARN
jgi:hypothetical protein